MDQTEQHNNGSLQTARAAKWCVNHQQSKFDCSLFTLLMLCLFTQISWELPLAITDTQGESVRI